MTLQGYEITQGYDELVTAHQARIRQVIAEEQVARQVGAGPAPWAGLCTQITPLPVVFARLMGRRCRCAWQAAVRITTSTVLGS